MVRLALFAGYAAVAGAADVAGAEPHRQAGSQAGVQLYCTAMAGTMNCVCRVYSYSNSSGGSG